MSVAGDAVPNEGGQNDDGGQPANEPVEIEGDVPKPAFDEPEPKPQEKAEAKGKMPRQERRENYDIAKYRDRAERTERELREMRDRLARFEGQREAERARDDRTADPIQTRLKELDRMIDGALSRMGTGDQTAYGEWKQLLQEQQRFIARAEAAELAREQAKNAPKPLDPVLAAVTARHDWLQTDPDARQIAEGVVARLVRLEKRDMSDPAVRRQTLLQAAAEVERDLGLGDAGHAEPTDVQRERFRGVSGQSSGAARGTGKTVIAMTADQKAQAEALFRHMEPEKAHREWWDKVGKTIAEKVKP